MLRLTLIVVLVALLLAPAVPAMANDLEDVLGALLAGYLIYEAFDNAADTPSHHGYCPSTPHRYCPPPTRYGPPSPPQWWERPYPGSQWGNPPPPPHRPGFVAPLPPSWHGQVPPQYQWGNGHRTPLPGRCGPPQGRNDHRGDGRDDRRDDRRDDNRRYGR